MTFPAMNLLVGAVALGVTALTTAQATQTVKIGYPPAWSAVEASIPFGDTLGFFREEGIELEYVSVQGTAVLIPQVANGSVEFGIMTPDLAVIAAARDEPFPVTYVYNFYPRNIFEFTVLADSPIESLAELSGKTLGVGALTWGNLPMSRLMLADAGVTWMEDVRVVPVGVGPAAWERLRGGSVDALNLPATQNVMMEQAGTPIRRLPIPEDFSGMFSNGLATSNALIESQPELVAAMGRAVSKSLEACMANTDACVRAYWQIDPSSRPSAADEETWVTTYQAVNEGSFAIGNVQERTGQHGLYTLADWENLVTKMLEGGQIDNMNFDIGTLFTDRFAETYNDFDVDAVRALAESVGQ